MNAHQQHQPDQPDRTDQVRSQLGNTSLDGVDGWAVVLAQPGCLPESDPMHTQDLDAARDAAADLILDAIGEIEDGQVAAADRAMPDASTDDDDSEEQLLQDCDAAATCGPEGGSWTLPDGYVVEIVPVPYDQLDQDQLDR